MAMNKWVKRKWVKALRSGEYIKGKYRLCEIHSGRTYCCLGVLACEMVPEFVKVNRDEGEVYIGRDKDDNGYLPDDLGIMFDLSRNQQQDLANMNDREDSFGPIADWIDANL